MMRRTTIEIDWVRILQNVMRYNVLIIEKFFSNVVLKNKTDSNEIEDEPEETQEEREPREVLQERGWKTQESKTRS